MARYLINFAGNLLEWYINISFLSALHKPRISKKWMILIGGMLTVLQFFNTNVFLTKSLFVVLGSILYSLFLAFLYRAKWYWRLLESLCLYAIIALPEIIFAMALQLLLPVDVAYTQTNMVLFAICTLTTKLLSILIVKFFRIRQIQKSIAAPWHVVLPMLLLPIATILVMAPFIQSVYMIQSRFFIILTLISMLMLLLANFVVFWIIEHQNDYIQTKLALRYAQTHIQNQAVHYKELYDFQMEMRKIRHDSKNKMLALSGLLESGEVEKARDLISKEVTDSESAANHIVNSGNPVIDAVLQSKYKTAQSKNVDLHVHIRLEEKIEMNELELGVLIGNAVDNAIEAAAKITDSAKPPMVRVQIRSLMHRIWISVDNPTVEESGPIDSLPTTKANPLHHGYGLKSIQSIVDNHDGSISISWEKHRFTIEVGLSNLRSNDFAE